MNRLDRYIARQYLINIVALFALFGALVVTIDVILNLDEFLKAGAQLAGERATLRHAVTSLLWIIDFWGPRLLQLFNYLLGMGLVAALGFTCVQLVRRRELVAAVAGGVSLHRLARPFLLVAALMLGVQALNQELVAPAIAPLLTRGQGDALRRDVKPFEVPLVRDGAGRLLYASRFDARTRTLEGVQIWERDAAGAVTRRIQADNARWDGSAWVLDAPRDPAARLGQRAAPPPDRLVTDLDPTALIARRYSDYGQNLSWRQIDRMLAHAPVDNATRERWDRLRYGRLSTMAGTFLAVVIALPFYLLREPRNMVGQTLKCAPLALGALMAAVIGPAAALPGVPAWLGVFASTAVLAPAALAAWVSIRT